MKQLNLGYIKNLDALRAFAALGVIFAHAYSIDVLPQFPIFGKISYLGNFGVSLFFVLSGFVITRILIHTHNEPSYFRAFYMRRLLRIFPLYYIGLLAYYFIPFFLGTESSITPFKEQLIFYTYLQNFSRTFDWNASGPGHYWSLAVEEHFYLLWPAVVYLCLKFRSNSLTLLRVSIIIILAVHALRVFMLEKDFNINVFTLTRLDQLVYGGIIAVAENRGIIVRKNLWLFISVALAGLLLIIMLESGSFLMKEAFKYTSFGIFFSGLICTVIVIPDCNVFSKMLQNKWLVYLGKISYGLYVWHVLAMMLVTYYFHGYPAIHFLLVIAATILIAGLSYRWLEQPFLKLKSKFEYRSNS